MAKENARRLLIFVTLFLASHSAPAAGAFIQFDFSGTFVECDVQCQASTLAVLEGTEFSGHIVIPSVGVDMTPSDPTRGLYSFNAFPAQMTLTTVSAEFSIAGAIPIEVWVNDCEGFCSIKDDYVALLHEGDSHSFYLVLSSTSTPKLSSDAIPDVVTLRSLRPGFQMLSNEFAAAINTDSFLVPSPMRLTITSVPIPAMLGAFAFASLITVLYKRRSVPRSMNIHHQYRAAAT